MNFIEPGNTTVNKKTAIADESVDEYSKLSIDEYVEAIQDYPRIRDALYTLCRKVSKADQTIQEMQRRTRNQLYSTLTHTPTPTPTTIQNKTKKSSSIQPLLSQNQLKNNEKKHLLQTELARRQTTLYKKYGHLLDQLNAITKTNAIAGEKKALKILENMYQAQQDAQRKRNNENLRKSLAYKRYGGKKPSFTQKRKSLSKRRL